MEFEGKKATIQMTLSVSFHLCNISDNNFAFSSLTKRGDLIINKGFALPQSVCIFLCIFKVTCKQKSTAWLCSIQVRQELARQECPVKNS